MYFCYLSTNWTVIGTKTFLQSKWMLLIALTQHIPHFISSDKKRRCFWMLDVFPANTKINYKRPKCAMAVRHTYVHCFTHPPTPSECLAQKEYAEKRAEKRGEKWILWKTLYVRDVPIKYLLTSSHWITTERRSFNVIDFYFFFFSFLFCLKTAPGIWNNNERVNGAKKHKTRKDWRGKKVPAIKKLMFDNAIWLLLCVYKQT